MSKYAMRRMMAKKNPLSIDGRIIPHGLQYAGGHDMGALHMNPHCMNPTHMHGAHYGMVTDKAKAAVPILVAAFGGFVIGQSAYMQDLLKGKKTVKANPRKRRRRNPSAHQARAAKAMRLYHSGKASSLKQAWKMV